MECDYGVVFGSEECEDCVYAHYCAEDDRYSQLEDIYRDMARGCDD